MPDSPTHGIERARSPAWVQVWDPLVRVFHWTLVASFAAAWLSGDDAETVHEVAGYLVLALVALRIAWGFVGSRHARFSDFVRGPREVARYLRSLLGSRPVHYLGHNPVGGWMVVALLTANLTLCWSGLEALADEGRGPLAGAETTLIASAQARDDDDDDDDDDDRGRGRGEYWEDVHEVLANLTLALVLVHVAGVGVSSVLHRENLVRAMITGRKPAKPGAT